MGAMHCVASFATNMNFNLVSNKMASIENACRIMDLPLRDYHSNLDGPNGA